MKYLAKLLGASLENAFKFTPKKFENPLEQSKLEEAQALYPHLEIALGNDMCVETITEVGSKSRCTLIFLIDVSGSISTSAKEHFAGLQEGIIESLDQYETVDVVVIPHTTQALEPTRLLDWLDIELNGGTIVSSAYKELPKYAKNNTDSDNYVVQLTDGDNWADDNKTVMQQVNKLALSGGVQGFKYFEVTTRPTQILGKAMINSHVVESYFMDIGEPSLKSIIPTFPN